MEEFIVKLKEMNDARKKLSKKGSRKSMKQKYGKYIQGETENVPTFEKHSIKSTSQISIIQSLLKSQKIEVVL